MTAIHKLMAEAKKKGRADALKDVKLLCKEFGPIAGMSQRCTC